jgi:hypothetical protein
MFQPATLLRWHRELVRRKWANRRIKGELLKLGITVSGDRHPDAPGMRIGFHRHPRGGPTWRQFIRAHAATIIAIDSFTIESVFLRTMYVIVFLELGSRRLLWADCTTNPDSAWVTQQARNVAYELEDLGLPVRFAIHDRDAKFTSGFDAMLESEGVEVIRTPYRAPRANSHCGNRSGVHARALQSLPRNIARSHSCSREFAERGPCHSDIARVKRTQRVHWQVLNLQGMSDESHYGRTDWFQVCLAQVGAEHRERACRHAPAGGTYATRATRAWHTSHRPKVPKARLL